MSREGEARGWFETNVSRETVTKLDRFAELLIEATNQQNLISASTIPDLWFRHFLDSAQIVSHSPDAGKWVDVGSGAGLPGIVVALLRREPMTLIEPRQLRATFLNHVVDQLGLAHVTVARGKAQQSREHDVAVISARAVAYLERLFADATHLAGPNTLWILHKGRSAREEVARAARSWQGTFTLVPSVTDPEASILIARDVAPRTRA